MSGDPAWIRTRLKGFAWPLALPLRHRASLTWPLRQPRLKFLLMPDRAALACAGWSAGPRGHKSHAGRVMADILVGADGGKTGRRQPGEHRLRFVHGNAD